MAWHYEERQGARHRGCCEMQVQGGRLAIGCLALVTRTPPTHQPRNRSDLEACVGTEHLGQVLQLWHLALVQVKQLQAAQVLQSEGKGGGRAQGIGHDSSSTFGGGGGGPGEQKESTASARARTSAQACCGKRLRSARSAVDQTSTSSGV